VNIYLTNRSVKSNKRNIIYNLCHALLWARI